MIVDASVAVPWLIETPFSIAARKIRDEAGIAPVLILLETTSSLLKYIRVGQLEKVELFRAVRALPIALGELVSDQSLLPAATRIAIEANHKIYDCLYLALAIERREPLATADRRLAALAQKFNIETQLIEPAL